MRNLKKLLALVLAMVMTFSLMLTASAVDYKDYQDKDNITEEFKEAVQVLTGLKVFQGDEGGFRPGDTITRAEVAAIIYRMATGDVDGNQVKIYADYGNFTDVDRNEWYAGYVGYCQNAGYIKGTSATTFDPNGQVTGWQALAMILRAVGYDKNHEFEGSDWQVNVASLARELGITNNVKNANFETTLSYSARRDVVADLLFQTAVLVPTVTYTSALSYSDKIALTETRKNATLGQKTFGLFVDSRGWQVVDDWGTPGYYWVKGGTHAFNSTFNATTSSWNSVYQYDSNWLPIYSDTVVSDPKATGYNVVATITPKATVEYDSANVHECDVAHDLDISTNKLFTLYVNRSTPITPSYNIESTDTVTRVGGQGRETKFWKDVESKWFTGKLNVCTMVDTYLATVTDVTERVLDPAGHVITPAYLYLDVYDGQAVGASDKTDGYEPSAASDTVERNTSEHRASKRDANWEYAKGDKVLVKGWTDYTQHDAAEPTGNPAVENANGLNHEFSQAEREQAAFETNRLQCRKTTSNTDYSADSTNHLTVVQKSAPVLGKQTVTYWNQGKHTVDGKDYNDQMTLFLDVAGTTTNTTYAWYFDTKGNLIGIDYVPDTVNYGVITSIWSSFTQGESSTTGEATTYAKVLYADGKEETITIDRFLVTQGNTIGTNGHVAPAAAGTAGAGLTIGTTGGLTDTAELIPVYDYNTSAGVTMAGATRSTSAKDAHTPGYLHVAPVASINEAQDKNADPNYGVIRGNLFKFEASADGKMTVIEVAGNDDNEGKFAGHYYTLNDDNSTTAKTGKLFKNLAYMSVDGGSTAFAWLDADTRVMVRGWDGTKATNTVKCYTLSDLPGDITIAPSTEIDWTDTDNDNRVDVVYLTGTVEGSITYGLFYYNGGAAQWNGVDKKGTLFGWLNGTPTTVNFDDVDEFNVVKNSQGYAGHLFALQLTNDVVSNVMGVNHGGTNDPYLLIPTAGTKITLSSDIDGTTTSSFTWATTNPDFGTGKANGNQYTTTTEAVYIEDVTGTPSGGGGDLNVSYTVSTKTVFDGTNTYYLTPTSKVIGLGMSVTQDSAILDYLNRTHNDVTIVYEISGTQRSIVEIYVATDPDNTTTGEVGTTITFGPGITAAPTGLTDGTTAGSVGAWLKNFNSGVFYCSDHKVNAGDKAGTGNLLYFPFVMSTDNPVPATLTIRDISGNVRFSETGTPAATGANIFRFDFLNAPGAWLGGTGLGAGTYSYDITVSGASVSSGSFTLIAQ